MKKILIVLLTIAVLATMGVSAIAAEAAVDLSSMSYEELVALKDQINLAIWASADWQEVTVPMGIWKIGEDIPAGHWTIKPSETDDYSYCYIKYGSALDQTKKDIEWDDSYVYESIVSEKSKGYNAISDKSECDFELVDGMYLIVDGSSTVFMPYSGKPSLGFK